MKIKEPALPNDFTLERKPENKYFQLYYFVIFFISGFSALIYQIVWQRILTNLTGTDIVSVTLVVGSFIGGLGFGSFLGGYLADKLGDKNRVILFALTQAAIAGFALSSIWFYYDFLFLQYHRSFNSNIGLFLVVFLSLLLPTTLMGMSLPLLAKTLIRRIETGPQITANLYGLNTLGASAGALSTTWLLLRYSGMTGAVHVGAMLNVICAIATLSSLAFRYLRFEGSTLEVQSSGIILDAPPSKMKSSLLPFWGWLLIYAISGFIALSLELLWFRILGVMLKSTSFTFGHLLAVLLGAMGLGTLWGTRKVRSSKEPIQSFLFFQGGIVVYTAIFLTIFILGIRYLSVDSWFWNYFGGDDSFDIKNFLSMPEKTASEFARLYIFLPFIFVGPPAFMMGLSYPFLQKVIQQDLSTLGRRIGYLQSANIIGSMTGAFITGLILIDVFGSFHSLKIILCISGIFLFLLCSVRLGKSALVNAAASAVLCSILILIIPSPPSSIWANLHGTSATNVISKEDRTGLCLLKHESADITKGITKVFVNGLGQSTVPFYDFHITFGIIPAMIHPNPKNIAIIGIGAGATLYAVGGRSETESITCVEIVKPLLDSLYVYNQRRSYPGLNSVLNDKRIAFVVGDGRSVILNGSKKYDIIEADALRTTSAYSGSLFSYDYFLLLKNHLKPHGIAVTAAPTQRIINSFVKVFPYALLIHTTDTMILGSNEKIEWDPMIFSERLRRPFTKNYYERAGIDYQKLNGIFEAKFRLFTPEFDRSKLLNFNTDLFPKDEFVTP